MLTAIKFYNLLSLKIATRKNNALGLAQLVERSTVVGNKHRTAAGSIPATQKHTSSGSVMVA